jgi:ABC-type nitrate/sulfonate/bicarbonate transport system permease component
VKKDARIYSFSGIVLLTAIWIMFVPDGGVFLSSFKEVAIAYSDVVFNGSLLVDVAESLKRVFVGVMLAFCVSVTLSGVSFFFKGFGHLVSGPIELFRPIPPIAWVPIAIVIFGTGDAPAVAIVALGAFFPIWLSLFRGVLDVREQHLLAARSLGASTIQCFFLVVVPSIMPHAFHGLRVGVGLGWFCVVAAEMMGAQTGLGYGVQLFSLNLQLPKTYCYILTIGIIGLVLNYIVVAIETRVCRWHLLEIEN